MRGLTIVVAGGEHARLRSALGLAAAQAAAGGAARLFLDSAAVPLLAPPVAAPDDRAHRAAGLPILAELVETCLALGSRIVLCQSGLALAGLDAATMDRRFEQGGMVGLLAALGDDRLVVA